MKTPITVWKFEDAPRDLQALSKLGGDEDWIAVVPDYLENEYIGWLQEGTAFGRYKIQEFDHPSIRGYKVKIGNHS